MATTNYTGFIKDVLGHTILPITRGELVLDEDGLIALASLYFEAGQKGNYGLISADDLNKLKALLGNSDDENQQNQPSSVEGLQAALLAVNNSLSINNVKLPFYTYNSGIIVGKEYNIISSDTIVATNVDNKILFTLSSVSVTDTTSGALISDVDVDSYGRVTNITRTSDLSGCVVTREASGDNDIVNKKYVDAKYSDAILASIGALRFEGALGTSELNKIQTILNGSSVGNYYKISEEFTISKSLFDSQTDVKVYPGDTLIVYLNDHELKRFVLIPSGDEVPTIINFLDLEGNAITAAQGATTIVFDEPFELTNEDSYTKITMPLASSKTAGIIDSDTFNAIQTATAKSMSYSPTIESTTAGAYELGKIAFGDDANSGISIYGKDTEYGLSLSTSLELILRNKLTDDELKIKFVGNSGIKVSTDQTSNLNIEINLGSSNKYLKINNNCLLANISEITENGLTNGLIDNTVLASCITSLLDSGVTLYEKIEHSLTTGSSQAPSGKNYKYGGLDLINAITVTI